MKRFTSVMLIVLVIALSLVTLMACKPKLEVDSVNVETVKYDGYKLTFGKVDNASYYFVQVNNGPQLKVEQSDNPSYEIELTENATFVITSVATDGENTVMAEPVSKSFTYGGKVQLSVNKQEGVVTFEPLEGVSEYIYKRNGQPASDKPVNNRIDILVGVNEITVLPVTSSEDVFYAWSDPVSARRLAPVEKLIFSNGTLSWTASEGASEYILRIQYGDQVIDTKTYDNAYLIDATLSDKDFSVSVKAASKEENVIDSSEKIANIKNINPIVDLKYSQGVLSFSPVQGATGYEVVLRYFNGGSQEEKILEVKESTFKLFDIFQYVDGVDSYDVKVRPVFSSQGVEGEFAVGKWTEISLRAYPKLQIEMDETLNLKFVNGLVDQDGYYVVNIDIIGEGRLEDININDNDILEKGEGYLTLKIGDNLTAYNLNTLRATGAQYSITAYYVYSNGTDTTIVSDEVIVFNIPSPNTYSVSSTDDGKYTIDFNDVILPEQFQGREMRYDLYLNGSIVATSSESKFVDIELKKEGATETTDNPFYVLCNIYNGGVIDDVAVLGNTVFISSNWEKAYKESLTVLGQVQELAFDYDTVITWGETSKASKYFVQIKKDGEYVYSGNTATPYFNLAELKLEAGNYEFEVKAKGNNGLVVTSLLPNSITFEKLGKITKLTGEDNLLTWDAVEGAGGYTVYIGNYIYPSQDNNFDLSTIDFESTTGMQVQIVANSNTANNKLKSDRSEVDFMVQRLVSPVVNLFNDKLVWAHDIYDKNVKYQVKSGDNNIGGVITPVDDGQGKPSVNVEFLTSNLPDGELDILYNLTVTAVADNGTVIGTDGGDTATYFMDSAKSNRIDVNKLRKPIIDNMQKDAPDTFNTFSWESGQDDTVNKQVMRVSVVYNEGSGDEYSDVRVIIGSQSFAPYIRETSGTFKIVFQYVGDGQTSVDSEPVEFGPFNIRQFTAPQVESVQTEAQKSLRIKLKAAAGEPVINYIYTVGGVDHVNKADELVYEMNSVGVYTIKARIEGGVYHMTSSTKDYYIESSETEHDKVIEKCRVVAENEIYKNPDDVLHFTNRLNGYTLKIDYVLKNVDAEGNITEVENGTGSREITVGEGTTLDLKELNTVKANNIVLKITILSQGTEPDRIYVAGDTVEFTYGLQQGGNQ